MTRAEFDALNSKVAIASELFKKQDSLLVSIAGITKCFLTVHNGDDVRAAGIRIKEQEAIRTIVLEQLNTELKDINQKIAEFSLFGDL